MVFQYILNYFWPKPDLNNILSTFNKAHDQLDTFIEHADGLMKDKTEEAKRLAEEAAQHSVDMARAAKAQLNIRSMLGL